MIGDWWLLTGRQYCTGSGPLFLGKPVLDQEEVSQTRTRCRWETIKKRARAPQFRWSSCTCISDRAPVKDEFWPMSNGILPYRECTRGVGMRTKCLCGPPEMHLSLALSPHLNSLLKIPGARERGGREGERGGKRERERERERRVLPHLFSSNSSCISSLANSSSWNSSSILSTSPQ